MLITGAAVHSGAHLNDSEVHMQLLGDMSAHIRPSDIAPVLLHACRSQRPELRWTRHGFSLVACLQEPAGEL